MTTILPDLPGLRPRSPAWLVDRPRLERRLDEPGDRRVTLVCAPSGSGKTTLVSAWAEQQPAAGVAWLSIGREHRRSGAFLHAVIETLAAASGIPTDPAGAATEVAQRNALDQVLRTGTGPLTLVLDDVHELGSRRAVDGLNRLVDLAPSWLHIVLISRADPPVRIGRLRVDGRFAGIRNSDLAMTPDEAAELFARHGVAIRDDDAHQLWGRTEGWAAGLALVAMALRGGADPHTFAQDDAATDAAVSDYLVGEVLARLDADDTACLLRTSVVEGITPDLAVALTDDPTAARRLIELERQGVFLTTTDGETYRFHALMAALLRAHLRRQDPELARRVHRTAARWYVDHDLPADAVDHAVAAEDWHLVGALVVDRWLGGLCAGELDAHVGNVPREVLLTTPALTAVAAAAASAAGRRSDAARFVEALDGLGPDRPSIAETHARLVARLLHACAFGDGDGGLAAATELDRPDVDAGLGVFVQLRRAELLVGLGRFDEARSVLDAIDRRAAPALAAEVHATTRLVTALSGRASDALAMPTSTSDSERARCIGLLAESVSRSAAGQTGRFPRLDDPTLEGVLAGSHAFSRCVVVLRACGPGRTWIDSSVSADPLADRLLVTLGVLEAYDHSGVRVVLGGDGEDALRRARHALETGGTRTALALLEPWDGGELDCHPRTRVEISVLSAVANDLTGAGAAADRHLRSALGSGCDTGVLAPLYDSAPRLERRISQLAVESGPHQSLAVSLLESCREPDDRTFTQQLTAKELVVLRFLPTLMSNAEIADTMNVSVNTVKTHLKGLYRKLGVERRREAVLRGRQLELLP